MLRSNSKQSGESCSQSWRRKGKAAVGRFAEKEGFKSGMKEWVEQWRSAKRPSSAPLAAPQALEERARVWFIWDSAEARVHALTDETSFIAR